MNAKSRLPACPLATGRVAGWFCVLTLMQCGVQAADYVFSTDTRTVFRNNQQTFEINGTPLGLTELRADGVVEFQFLGDLRFLDGDNVRAVGDHPLALLSGDDVFIDPGAVLDFTPRGASFPDLGGGFGGNFGDRLSQTGGQSGQGGMSGGAAGARGTGGPLVFIAGQPGTDGGNGANGSSGDAGTAGLPGGLGGAAFNNPASGGAAGSAGTAGFAGGGGGGGLLRGIDDDPVQSGRYGGGGLGGAVSSFETNPFFGDVGFTGQDGRPGGGAGPGGPGAPGQGGTNNVVGNFLSGGGAGGGGGSGGNGGGGGGGGAGGGGGGGGGGKGDLFAGGGNGGNGGVGGPGGSGGEGGVGGRGGSGGAGGAAVEIVAQGRLFFGGTISSRGRPGLLGESGSVGQSGSAGLAGAPGSPGDPTLTSDILDGEIFRFGGGDGGAGGTGGTGGTGGRGGRGGQGGGGAGGTVRFQATLIDATGGTINTSGGQGASPAGNGSDGRYVVAFDNEAPTDLGAAISARTELFATGGVTNPYIEGGTTSTSNVPGLRGGADAYGVLDRVESFNPINSFDAFFDGVRSNAPEGAIAAVVRAGSVPGLPSIVDQDVLLLVNLTASPVDGAGLGVVDADAGSGFTRRLSVQGFSRNPTFGGGGPLFLPGLPGNAVFATLVPDNGGIGEAGVNVATLADGVQRFNLTDSDQSVNDAGYLTTTEDRFDMTPGVMVASDAIGDPENSTDTTSYDGPTTLFSRLSMASVLVDSGIGPFASDINYNIRTTSGGDYTLRPFTPFGLNESVASNVVQTGLFFANAGDDFTVEAFETFEDESFRSVLSSDTALAYDQPAETIDLGDFPEDDFLFDVSASEAPRSVGLYTADGSLIGGADGAVGEFLAAGDYLALVGAPGSSFFSGAAFANPGGGGFTLNLNGAEIAQGVLPFGQFATFAFTVQSGLPGDYNEDGVVDAVDYTVWRDNLGQPDGTLPNDIDGGLIGPAQYATWQDNFGETGPVVIGLVTTPEPAGMLLVLTAAALAMGLDSSRGLHRGWRHF